MSAAAERSPGGRASSGDSALSEKLRQYVESAKTRSSTPSSQRRPIDAFFGGDDDRLENGNVEQAPVTPVRHADARAQPDAVTPKAVSGGLLAAVSAAKKKMSPLLRDNPVVKNDVSTPDNRMSSSSSSASSENVTALASRFFSSPAQSQQPQQQYVAPTVNSFFAASQQNNDTASDRSVSPPPNSANKVLMDESKKRSKAAFDKAKNTFLAEQEAKADRQKKLKEARERASLASIERAKKNVSSPMNAAARSSITSVNTEPKVVTRASIVTAFKGLGASAPKPPSPSSSPAPPAVSSLSSRSASAPRERSSQGDVSTALKRPDLNGARPRSSSQSRRVSFSFDENGGHRGSDMSDSDENENDSSMFFSPSASSSSIASSKADDPLEVVDLASSINSNQGFKSHASNADDDLQRQLDELQALLSGAVDDAPPVVVQPVQPQIAASASSVSISMPEPSISAPSRPSQPTFVPAPSPPASSQPLMKTVVFDDPRPRFSVESMPAADSIQSLAPSISPSLAPSLSVPFALSPALSPRSVPSIDLGAIHHQQQQQASPPSPSSLGISLSVPSVEIAVPLSPSSSSLRKQNSGFDAPMLSIDVVDKPERKISDGALQDMQNNTRGHFVEKIAPPKKKAAISALSLLKNAMLVSKALESYKPPEEEVVAIAASNQATVSAAPSLASSSSSSQPSIVVDSVPAPAPVSIAVSAPAFSISVQPPAPSTPQAVPQVAVQSASPSKSKASPSLSISVTPSDESPAAASAPESHSLPDSLNIAAPSEPMFSPKRATFAFPVATAASPPPSSSPKHISVLDDSEPSSPEIESRGSMRSIPERQDLQSEYSERSLFEGVSMHSMASVDYPSMRDVSEADMLRGESSYRAPRSDWEIQTLANVTLRSVESEIITISRHSSSSAEGDNIPSPPAVQVAVEQKPAQQQQQQQQQHVPIVVVAPAPTPASPAPSPAPAASAPKAGTPVPMKLAPIAIRRKINGDVPSSPVVAAPPSPASKPQEQPVLVVAPVTPSTPPLVPQEPAVSIAMEPLTKPSSPASNSAAASSSKAVSPSPRKSAEQSLPVPAGAAAALASALAPLHQPAAVAGLASDSRNKSPEKTPHKQYPSAQSVGGASAAVFEQHLDIVNRIAAGASTVTAIGSVTVGSHQAISQVGVVTGIETQLQKQRAEQERQLRQLLEMKARLQQEQIDRLRRKHEEEEARAKARQQLMQQQLLLQERMLKEELAKKEIEDKAPAPIPGVVRRRPRLRPEAEAAIAQASPSYPAGFTPSSSYITISSSSKSLESVPAPQKQPAPQPAPSISVNSPSVGAFVTSPVVPSAAVSSPTPPPPPAVMIVPPAMHPSPVPVPVPAAAEIVAAVEQVKKTPRTISISSTPVIIPSSPAVRPPNASSPARVSPQPSPPRAPSPSISIAQEPVVEVPSSEVVEESPAVPSVSVEPVAPAAVVTAPAPAQSFSVSFEVPVAATLSVHSGGDNQAHSPNMSSAELQSSAHSVTAASFGDNSSYRRDGSSAHSVGSSVGHNDEMLHTIGSDDSSISELDQDEPMDSESQHDHRVSFSPSVTPKSPSSPSRSPAVASDINDKSSEALVAISDATPLASNDEVGASRVGGIDVHQGGQPQQEAVQREEIALIASQGEMEQRVPSPKQQPQLQQPAAHSSPSSASAPHHVAFSPSSLAPVHGSMARMDRSISPSSRGVSFQDTPSPSLQASGDPVAISHPSSSFKLAASERGDISPKRSLGPSASFSGHHFNESFNSTGAMIGGRRPSFSTLPKTASSSNRRNMEDSFGSPSSFRKSSEAPEIVDMDNLPPAAPLTAAALKALSPKAMGPIELNISTEYISPEKFLESVAMIKRNDSRRSSSNLRSESSLQSQLQQTPLSPSAVVAAVAHNHHNAEEDDQYPMRSSSASMDPKYAGVNLDVSKLSRNSEPSVVVDNKRVMASPIPAAASSSSNSGLASNPAVSPAINSESNHVAESPSVDNVSSPSVAAASSSLSPPVAAVAASSAAALSSPQAAQPAAASVASPAMSAPPVGNFRLVRLVGDKATAVMSSAQQQQVSAASSSPATPSSIAVANNKDGAQDARNSASSQGVRISDVSNVSSDNGAEPEADGTKKKVGLKILAKSLFSISGMKKRDSNESAEGNNNNSNGSSPVAAANVGSPVSVSLGQKVIRLSGTSPAVLALQQQQQQQQQQSQSPSQPAAAPSSPAVPATPASAEHPPSLLSPVSVSASGKKTLTLKTVSNIVALGNIMKSPVPVAAASSSPSAVTSPSSSSSAPISVLSPTMPGTVKRLSISQLPPNLAVGSSQPVTVKMPSPGVAQGALSPAQVIRINPAQAPAAPAGGAAPVSPVTVLKPSIKSVAQVAMIAGGLAKAQAAGIRIIPRRAASDSVAAVSNNAENAEASQSPANQNRASMPADAKASPSSSSSSKLRFALPAAKQ